MTGMAFLQSTPSVFLLLILACSFPLSFIIPMDLESQLIVSSIAIALTGLPHGAADAWIAGQSGLANDIRRMTIFILFYIVISFLIIMLWLIFPIASLAIFLVISSWHFGDDNRLSLSSMSRFCSGITIISLPAIFHKAEILSFYEALSGNGADIIILLQTIMFCISGCCLVYDYLISNDCPNKKTNMINLGILILISFTLPPLIYFTLYFCGMHSWQHMRRVLAMEDSYNNRNLITHIILLTLVVIISGMAIGVWLVSMGGLVNVVNIKVLFIGLAALSFPHIILIDYYKADINSFAK